MHRLGEVALGDAVVGAQHAQGERLAGVGVLPAEELAHQLAVQVERAHVRAEDPVRERIDALGVGERAGCAVTVVHERYPPTQTVGAGNG